MMNSIDLSKLVVMLCIIIILSVWLGSFLRIITLILLISVYIVLDNWDKYKYLVASYSKMFKGVNK